MTIFYWIHCSLILIGSNFTWKPFVRQCSNILFNWNRLCKRCTVSAWWNQGPSCAFVKQENCLYDVLACSMDFCYCFCYRILRHMIHPAPHQHCDVWLESAQFQSSTKPCENSGKKILRHFKTPTAFSSGFSCLFDISNDIIGQFSSQWIRGAANINGKFEEIWLCCYRQFYFSFVSRGFSYVNECTWDTLASNNAAYVLDGLWKKDSFKVVRVERDICMESVLWTKFTASHVNESIEHPLHNLLHNRYGTLSHTRCHLTHEMWISRCACGLRRKNNETVNIKIARFDFFSLAEYSLLNHSST